MKEILKVLDAELHSRRKDNEGRAESFRLMNDRWQSLYKDVQEECATLKDKLAAAHVRVTRTQEIMKVIANNIDLKKLEALSDNPEVQRNCRMLFDRAEKDWSNW